MESMKILSPAAIFLRIEEAIFFHHTLEFSPADLEDPITFSNKTGSRGLMAFAQVLLKCFTHDFADLLSSSSGFQPGSAEKSFVKNRTNFFPHVMIIARYLDAVKTQSHDRRVAKRSSGK